MAQINSKFKDDFQIVFLLLCFVGHSVPDVKYFQVWYKVSNSLKKLNNHQLSISRCTEQIHPSKINIKLEWTNPPLQGLEGGGGGGTNMGVLVS